MFNLENIEKDWIENSRSLSEEEILGIFKEDNATIPQYEKSMEEWHKKIKVSPRNLTAEERLLRKILGETEEEKRESEKYQKLLEERLAKYPKPEKQHLSKENQKRVVEGSMNLVFDNVRYYYNIFEFKISEEILYYLLLESLINVARYMIHCGDPVFNLYVQKSFKNSIAKYISRIEKVSFDKAKDIISYYETKSLNIENFCFDDMGEERYNLSDKESEDPVSPFELNFLLRDKTLNEDLMEKLNTEEFFKDYRHALDELSEEEKIVMQLSYDIYGYMGLTYGEIADYLGIEKKKVASIKKKALNHIRKNELLNK